MGGCPIAAEPGELIGVVSGPSKDSSLGRAGETGSCMGEACTVRHHRGPLSEGRMTDPQFLWMAC